MTLDFHPFADLFPLIEGDDFERFAIDIRDHGLRDKIVLFDGKILDGRNRYRAALHFSLPGADGDAAWFRDFDPLAEGEPLTWVLSKNLARRHLNESQRAMVAAKLANMPGHRPADKDANLRTSGAEAAQLLHVSARSVSAARAVREKGITALMDLVEAGRIAISQAEQAARLDAAAQARVVQLVGQGKANAVRTVIKQGAREIREQQLGQKQRALPTKKYGVILADPEWRFETYSAAGLDRSPDNHYPTSSEAQITARDVAAIAADDAMLAIWVTDLARGIRVLESWGFYFKSYFVWVKDIVWTAGVDMAAGEGPSATWYKTVGPAGNGYWNRDRDELLLIGTRGKFVAPAMGTQPESVWFAARPKVEGSERGRHSAKPENAHLWIEQNWPSLAKIELNARAGRPGWDVWGNEAPAAQPDNPNADGQPTEQAPAPESQQNQAQDENGPAEACASIELAGGGREIAQVVAPAAPKFVVMDEPEQILDPVTGAMPIAKAFDLADEIPAFLRRAPKQKKGISP
jgi:N6-adenosine-specific RNA methylase IME4